MRWSGLVFAAVVAVIGGLGSSHAHAVGSPSETRPAAISIQDLSLRSALVTSADNTMLRLVVPSGSTAALGALGFDIGAPVGSLPFVRAAATARQIEAAAAAGLGTGLALDVLVPHPTAERDIATSDSTLINWSEVTGATALHARGVTGRGVGVAVIDTGIQASHPYFRGADGRSRVVAESCFVDNTWRQPTLPCPGGGASAIGPGAADIGDNTNYPFPHGTHVAGIAAGNANGVPGARGYTGMAPEASLIISRVFGDGGAYPSDIAQALDWVASVAATHNIGAVNLSLGAFPGPRYFDCSAFSDSIYGAAAAKVMEAGVAVVASAGNEGSIFQVGSPACGTGWISVGATDWLGRVATFSNVSEGLDIMAPGQDLWSAWPGDSFQFAAGTSMASPVVAGAFGLMREARPQARDVDVLAAMRATGPQIDDIMVKGLPTLRIDRAHSLLSDPSYPAMATRVTVETDATSATVSWSVSDIGARPTAYEVRVGNRSVTTTATAHTFHGVSQSDLRVYVTPRAGDAVGASSPGPTAFAIDTAIPEVIGEAGSGYAADFCPGGGIAASFAYPKTSPDPGPRPLRVTAGPLAEGSVEYDRFTSPTLYRFDITDPQLADAPALAVQALSSGRVSPTQYVSDLLELIPGGVPQMPARLMAKTGVGTIQLTWRPGGASQWRVVVDGEVIMTTTEPRAVISNLGGEHEVAVCAVGDSGSTSRAARLSADVPAVPEAPDSPLMVRALPGDRQVAVSWQAPASDGGSTITSYVATASPGGARCSTSGALTCTVPGLANGTAYSFTVTAANSIGTSSPSLPSDPVTPLTVPSAPRNPTGVAGDGQVLVKWETPVSDGGAAVTGYVVSASPGGAQCTTSGELTCAVTGLTNGIAYTFSVIAINAAGESSPSVTPSITPRSPVIKPGMVTGLKATALRGSIRVTWSAPKDMGGASSVMYQYRVGQGAWQSTGATRVSVTGRKGARIAVQVRAVNESGPGPSLKVSAAPR